MSSGRYPVLVRRLHWLTVGLFVWQWLSRGLAAQLPGDSALAFHLHGLHTVGGVLILVLAATRLAVRFRQGSPGWPNGLTRLQRRAATVVHGILYAIMFLQPLIGLAAVQNPAFAAAHVALGWIALGMIAVHAGAALWHRLVARDAVFSRIAW